MKLEFKNHRCFHIDNDSLDLFVTALYINFTDTLIRTRAEWIFERGEFYDVIVAVYGDNPHVEKQLEKFANNPSN